MAGKNYYSYFINCCAGNGGVKPEKVDEKKSRRKGLKKKRRVEETEQSLF